MPLVTEDGRPFVHLQEGYVKCDFIPGLFGPCKKKDVFLDRVIAHAEMVGTLISKSNPKERGIQLPSEGSSAKFLMKIFGEIKDLNIIDNPEESIRAKRKRVIGLFEFLAV